LIVWALLLFSTSNITIIAIPNEKVPVVYSINLERFFFLKKMKLLVSADDSVKSLLN